MGQTFDFPMTTAKAHRSETERSHRLVRYKPAELAIEGSGGLTHRRDAFGHNPWGFRRRQTELRRITSASLSLIAHHLDPDRDSAEGEQSLKVRAALHEKAQCNLRWNR